MRDPPVSRHAVRFLQVVLALLAVAAASPDTHAAEARTLVAFDYGLGVDGLQIRDDLLRPLRWTGVGVSLRLGLDVDTGNLVHDGGVTLGAGALWNRFDHLGMLLDHGLNYGLLARVARRRPVGVLAGVVYRYESLDAYYADWDDSFLYWFTTHTLAPAVAFEATPFTATRVWARMEIPLVGLSSRPPEARVYKVDPIPYFERHPALVNRDPAFVGPTDLLAPTLSARVDRGLGRHLGLRLGIDVWYRHALEPRAFFALGERLVAELRHVF